MQQTKAKIISNQKVGSKYFHCAFNAAAIAKNAIPGQFVNIKLTQTLDPLLRRPFSIHQVKGEIVEILYEAVGKGSEILSQKKPGEYLDMIGPLGNGFSVSRLAGSPVLVAGGMGIAPLVFLAEKLITRTPAHPHTRTPMILIGAKTKNDILCAQEFKKLGCQVKIATDDGSRRFKGKVTGLLKKVLLEPKTQFALNDAQNLKPSIYACGPKPMLKEISAIAKNYKIPAQISLEEHMSCGIGACLGCAVDTKQGFKRVCIDGPVFKAEEIIW